MAPEKMKLGNNVTNKYEKYEKVEKTGTVKFIQNSK